MRHSRARIIALGGIFSALAMVLLLAGGFIPIGTFAAPIFAGICLLPIAIDIGAKWALVCYAAVSLLSVLMVPDKELVLFFIVLFGWYPIVQPFFSRLKTPVLRYAIKLALFNAAVAAVYVVLLLLYTSPGLREEFAGRAPWFWAALLVVANLTFLLYDRLLTRLRPIYITRIRKYIFRN